MPSTCGSLCLMLVLAAVMVLGGPVQSMTDDTIQVLDAIKDELNLADAEISSRPLFNAVIKSINTACMRKEQIQLINTTLDVYARIFSNILHRQRHHTAQTLLDQLNEPTRSKVVSSLTYLQTKMEDLKKRLSGVHHRNLNHEDMLTGLRRIKGEEPEEQRRALAQFKEVHRAASVIADRTCTSTHWSV